MYIWALKDWPSFEWREPTLRPLLDDIRLLQGRVVGRTETSEHADASVEMDTLLQSAIRTSEIEGERLDVSSVRLSVARQLGLEQAGVLGRTTPESEALIKLLLQATHYPD